MKWNNATEIPIPKDEWVLCYAMQKQMKFTKNGFVDEIEFTDGPNIYVVKDDSYSGIEVNTNTCGCCSRELVIISWAILPKPLNRE